MALEMHPEAVRSFNERAAALTTELETPPSRAPVRGGNSSFPEPFVSARIKPDDIIGESRFGMVDHTGAEVAKYFDHEGKTLGLSGEKYRRLVLLSEQMQNSKELHSIISLSFITDAVFDWVRDYYKGVVTIPMVEYVLSRCEASIEDLEVWVPIAMLYVQSETTIGRLTFRTLTKEMFDQWRLDAKQKHPLDYQKIWEALDREQKPLQGLAASTLRIQAERERAFEIAMEETTKSVAVLRFFSPANFHPRARSYCAPLGTENLQQTIHLLLTDDNLIETTSATVDKGSKRWVIPDVALSMIKKGGLDILSGLLVKDSLTSFQKELLDSVLLYSRSSLMADPADKMIYMFAALESILLRSDSEAVAQNIGERMSFVVGTSADERKAIVANAKQVYSLRSKFVHHGHAVKDTETLHVFMRNSWTFLSMLIQSANRYQTREELIDTLEHMKLS